MAARSCAQGDFYLRSGGQDPQGEFSEPTTFWIRRRGASRPFVEILMPGDIAPGTWKTPAYARQPSLKTMESALRVRPAQDGGSIGAEPQS